MDIESWLSPHWSWLSLLYPAWRALEQCERLILCSGATAAVLVFAYALLSGARELASLRLYRTGE